VSFVSSERPTARPLKWLAGWVSGKPFQALGVVLAMTLVMGFFARTVRLDNNFAQLFSTTNTAAKVREQYRETWGPDDGLLIAVLESKTPSTGMIPLVDSITVRLQREMNELTRVDSITTTPVVRQGITPPVGPAADAATAELSFDQRVQLAATSDLGAGALVNNDGTVTLIAGDMGPKYDSFEKITAPAEKFQKIVNQELRRAGNGFTAHFAGVAFTRIAAISEMQGDLLKLFPVATLAMMALLWWFFRRPIAVIAPLMAITVSTLCTAGVIGLRNDNINQVTIIYPVLLMGVVVATATHLLHRFFLERAAGASAADAARLTLERITRAAIVCTITNAVGFISLWTAKMAILHEFGLYLAAGVVFCFVATSLLIPAMLVWRDAQPPARYLVAGAEDATKPLTTPRRVTLTERYARTVTTPRNAALVLVGGVVLGAAAVGTSTTATYDYSLSGMLNADRPISVGNAIIDKELSGIVPVEISLRGPAGSFESADIAQRLTALDTWLSENEGLRSVGLPSLYRAGTTLTGIDPTQNDATLRLFAESASETVGASTLARIVTNDASATRLRSFHADTGAQAIVAMSDRIDAKAAELFRGTGVRVDVTGEAPVAYAGMNDLTRELVVSTLLALAMVVIAIGIAFRSITMALVAMLPNSLPILCGLAIYTLARGTLDPVPGVVFCVAVGLAADDTVHLMNRMRELRPSYPTTRDALIAALTSVRRAMVSSSAVLIAAFLALGISGFPTNRTLGVLGAVVLLLALGSDLLFGTAGLAVAAYFDGRSSKRRAARATAGSTARPSEPIAAPDPATLAESNNATSS
jgi:predicted RND superfamily exporter protein